VKRFLFVALCATGEGQTRSRAASNVGKGEDSIEVSYRTQRCADEGRLWFGQLADGAVSEGVAGTGPTRTVH
jgi:hypothetical protein